MSSGRVRRRRDDRRSAMYRACSSAPPLMSAPYRCTTIAIFIRSRSPSASGTRGDGHCSERGGFSPVERVPALGLVRCAGGSSTALGSGLGRDVWRFRYGDRLGHRRRLCPRRARVGTVRVRSDVVDRLSRRFVGTSSPSARRLRPHQPGGTGAAGARLGGSAHAWSATSAPAATPATRCFAG